MRVAIRSSTYLVILLLMADRLALGQTSNRRGNDCLVCHTCEIPTKLNPCLRSCPRGQMITVHHSADAGPDNIMMEKLTGGPDLYEPALFSHRAHARMSEMSGNCVMCHHYNPPGGVLPCSDCHAAGSTAKNVDLSKPGLKGAYHRQCVNCHREWGSAADCESCHLSKTRTRAAAPGGSKVKGAIHAQRPKRMVFETQADEGKLVTFFHNEHTDLFGLACSDCHANERCMRCHRPEAASAQAVAHVTQGHDRCSPCHVVEENCSRCHGEQPRSGFSHARRSGFDLGRYHSSFTCKRCHGEKSNYEGLSSNCISCHARWESGSFDHRVTGLKLDETHSAIGCESCHIDKDFSRNPSCNGCHDDKSYPDATPGTRVRPSRTKRL